MDSVIQHLDIGDRSGETGGECEGGEDGGEGSGFFFQAEDGIRDRLVTGVQTCALPISEVEGVGGDLKSKYR
mgnify:CR=1 FL=1